MYILTPRIHVSSYSSSYGSFMFYLQSVKTSCHPNLSIKFMTKWAILLQFEVRVGFINPRVCVQVKFTHPLLPLLLSKFDFKVIVVQENSIVYKCSVVTSLDKHN